MADLPDGPSPSVQRARRLLRGGVIGGHIALGVCVLVFGVVGGAFSAASAALAGVVTIGFFMIGQAVQVLVADAEPGRILLASLLSYAGRIGVLGVLLALALSNRGRLTAMDPVAVVMTTIAVVVGWLAAEIWVFSRLRIPVFDEPRPRNDTTC